MFFNKRFTALEQQLYDHRLFTINLFKQYKKDIQTIVNSETSIKLSKFYIYKEGTKNPIIIEATSIVVTDPGVYSREPRFITVYNGEEQIALVTNVNGWKKESLGEKNV